MFRGLLFLLSETDQFVFYLIDPADNASLKVILIIIRFVDIVGKRSFLSIKTLVINYNFRPSEYF